MSIVAETATLAWGYTMADVDRLATQVAKTSHVRYQLDPADRLDYGWHAIVETLYSEETVEAPSEPELIRIGFNALRAAVDDNLHHHGSNRAGHKRHGLQTGPGFARYWGTVAGAADDFTDRIIEKLALPQVLSTLTDAEYEAIAALAVYGSNDVAAAALGMKRAAFNMRISKARRRVIAHWLAPESAPSPPDYTLTCSHGHAWAEHGYRAPNGRMHCRLCRRNYARLARNRAEKKRSVSQQELAAVPQLSSIEKQRRLLGELGIKPPKAS